MRAFLIAAAVVLTHTAHAGEHQTIFEQIVTSAGATQGAARSCGAAEPDLREHAANWHVHLKRYAQEYGFDATVLPARFAEGEAQGRAMMEQMRGSGEDGCAGVMGSFQRERAIGYTEMKQAIAEVTDGLPDKAR